jgi:DNA (cytosine-5)-methyltransferase 1
VKPPLKEPTVAKIQRLGRGERIRVLDLFSGCGGISLGFHRAGFEIVGGVEIDPDAARTHALNFHADVPEVLLDRHKRPKDITVIEPEELLAEYGYTGDPARQVDVVVGGPPCQAFARVGRAKLREVAKHPEAFLGDPRSNLYLRYLHFVTRLKPLAILMENVPDVLNYGGHNIAEEICEVLSDQGYVCGYTLLNSVYFGVPQMRERMFLIAYSRGLGLDVDFPRATHWVDLPKGYIGSRQVALQTISRSLFDPPTFYQDPPSAEGPGLSPAVTAEEALQDLPRITKHLSGGLKRGARRFLELTEYPIDAPLSDYGRTLREWPGFENSEGVYDHVTRSLPRDYKIFREMRPGDQYPEAYELAWRMFRSEVEAVRRRGSALPEESSQYEDLKRKFVPPYDSGKFPNKWRKMERDRPARTLMAHLGKDGYSHIHYDSGQARTISVREAARLQSFPDGFRFSGTMNPAFRQIGNAVPPLMGYSLAKLIRQKIERRVHEDSDKETHLVGSNLL